MDLPRICNAPRELALGGAIFRARCLTLADLGEVLAWLDDRLPKDERDGPPPLSSEAARVALSSDEGLAVVLHLSLAACHPALTRLKARALASTMTEDDQRRLHAIAFRRRPISNADADNDGSPAKDLAEIDWGPIVEALAQHRAWCYPEVLRMTLDQYDCHVQRGEVAGPDDLSPAQVQAMWEAAQGQGEAVVPVVVAEAAPPETDQTLTEAERLLAVAKREGWTVAKVHDEPETEGAKPA